MAITCNDILTMACRIDDAFELVDEYSSEKEVLIFHKRRIECLCDCLKLADIALFAPKNREEIENYMAQAVRFWEGKLSQEQALDIQRRFNDGYYKDIRPSSPEWESRITLSALMSVADDLDWMWIQYMEMGATRLVDAGVDCAKVAETLRRWFPEELLMRAD